MKNKFIIILILLTGFQNIFAQKQPIYPEPEKGFKRVDLQLQKIENENDFKIEITFGMESESDECTKETFSFEGIETKYAEPPRAYPFYVIKANTIETIGGKIPNCTSNKKVKKIILSDKKLFENYASAFIRRFYIPEKWTIEYRIWKTTPRYESLK